LPRDASCMVTIAPLVNSQCDSIHGGNDFELIDCYLNRIEFSRIRQKQDSRGRDSFRLASMFSNSSHFTLKMIARDVAIPRSFREWGDEHPMLPIQIERKRRPALATKHQSTLRKYRRNGISPVCPCSNGRQNRNWRKISGDSDCTRRRFWTSRQLRPHASIRVSGRGRV
jgi:hypothetical protein